MHWVLYADIDPLIIQTLLILSFSPVLHHCNRSENNLTCLLRLGVKGYLTNYMEVPDHFRHNFSNDVSGIASDN